LKAPLSLRSSGVAPPSLGDAEVEQLHAAGGETHDVGRAHVAVDDVERAAVGPGQLVRVGQPGGHLPGDVRRDRHRQDLAGSAQLPHERLQIAAAQVLHRQEVAAFDLTEVIDGDDVRVIEQRADLRLLHEHLDEAGRARELREDALEHERPPEALGARHDRPKDLRHSAHPNSIQQNVATESLGLDRFPRWHHPALLSTDRTRELTARNGVSQTPNYGTRDAPLGAASH